jgi:rSAM/selenodomain-associated transferase 1
MLPEFPDALVVVAKRPAAGNTKTRLSPPLSPEQASAFYESFLLDTLDQMRRVKGVEHLVAYTPPDAAGYFEQVARGFKLVAQQGRDLGERLDAIMTWCLSHGYRRVVIMDSDSPTLPLAYLEQAFHFLWDGAQAVLGPCDDGGYYLIGARQPIPRLLRGVRMSTPTVGAETIALAHAEGLDLAQLPAWYDVDDVASLARLDGEIAKLDARAAMHTRRSLAQDPVRDLFRTAG